MKSLQNLRRAIKFNEVKTVPIFTYLCMATFATKMRGTVTKNKKDSKGRRLGLKKTGGEGVFKNDIILRQRGFKYKPGENVHYGKDQTLHASKEGVVTFTTDPYFNYKRTRVHVVEKEIRNKEVQPPKPFMYHPELYPELAESNIKMEPYLIREKINAQPKAQKIRASIRFIPAIGKLAWNRQIISSIASKSRSTSRFNDQFFDIESVQKKLIPSLLLENISKSKEVDELSRDREIVIDSELKEHFMNFELNKKRFSLSTLNSTINQNEIPKQVTKLIKKSPKKLWTKSLEASEPPKAPIVPINPIVYFNQSEEVIFEVSNYLSLDSLNSKIKSCETLEELSEFKETTQNILDEFTKLLESDAILFKFTKNLMNYTSIDKENMASKYITLKYYNLFKSQKKIIQKEIKNFQLILEKIAIAERSITSHKSYILKRITDSEKDELKSAAFKRREVKVPKKLNILAH